MAEQKAGWDETKVIWNRPENRLFYKLLGAVVLVGIGVLVGRVIYAAPEADQAWGYGVNLFTGVISTAATVLILDQLAERRADRKAEQARQQQLVEDAASNVNDVANNAVYQLQRRGWLTGEGGLLQVADLRGANLQGAALPLANLQGANLIGAELQGANLIGAKLQGADLFGAELQGAILIDAKLQGADLSMTKLQGADLRGAKLQGADLRGANLQGAGLDEAIFDEKTMLPDGSPWLLTTGMEQFTDAEREDFWRSDNELSPAFRGKSKE